MKTSAFRLLRLLPATLLAGCSLMPPDLLPRFALPENYREAPTAGIAAIPAEAAGEWTTVAEVTADTEAPWARFDLPELPGLLQRLEKANANLAAARARYDQAAALLAQTDAARYPKVDASGSVTRARSTGATAGVATTQTLSVASSWEIDLWGRLRAASLASEAAVEASAADLAGQRLALQAQLVQALLSLRIVDVQRQMLDAAVADNRRYLALTEARVRYGVAGKADLAQAETQLRTTEAQAIETGVQRAQLTHAIAVLLGELPSQFDLPAPPSAADWRAPLRGEDGAAPASVPRADILRLAPGVPTVPLTLPSVLLERRPDIAAAARRVSAANARIGVARAASFPVLSLSASIGGRASGWNDLFSSPARLWSIGPGLTLPIFDAGLRRAQRAEAEAAWDEAGATYRQTVLAAFQEVEDQLAALRVLGEEAGVQGEAVRAARQSAELTLAQYRAGTASSLQVIVANNTLLAAERAALDLLARRLTAAVTLTRALGGGWQAASAP